MVACSKLIHWSDQPLREAQIGPLLRALITGVRHLFPQITPKQLTNAVGVEQDTCDQLWWRTKKRSIEQVGDDYDLNIVSENCVAKKKSGRSPIVAKGSELSAHIRKTLCDHPYDQWIVSIK